MPKTCDQRLELMGFGFHFFLSSKWLFGKYYFCLFTRRRNFGQTGLNWYLCWLNLRWRTVKSALSWDLVKRGQEGTLLGTKGESSSKYPNLRVSFQQPRPAHRACIRLFFQCTLLRAGCWHRHPSLRLDRGAAWGGGCGRLGLWVGCPPSWTAMTSMELWRVTAL